MQQRLDGGKDEHAIRLIREHEPVEGYLVTYSGGKDSDTVRRLVELAGVRHELVYLPTGLDPGEVQDHIRNFKVRWDRPERLFFPQLIRERYPPTPRIRWCCKRLKEQPYPGRVVITGIRAEESNSRAKRRMFEASRAGNGQRFFHPIFDWLKDDVFSFAKKDGLKLCSLYAEGWDRIGCIGCPMGSRCQREQQFKRWPLWKAAWVANLDKMIAARVQRGMNRRWENGAAALEWMLCNHDRLATKEVATVITDRFANSC